MWESPGHARTQQHQRELTWGQEDAGTGLGGIGQLAEPFRVSILDVLCPEPGNRVRAGQWGAVRGRGMAEGAALTVGVPGDAGSPCGRLPDSRRRRGPVPARIPHSCGTGCSWQRAPGPLLCRWLRRQAPVRGDTLGSVGWAPAHPCLPRSLSPSPQTGPAPSRLNPQCPPALAPAWLWSSSSWRMGCPSEKRRISSTMCTPWFTRTALCSRPSSANTGAMLSRAAVVAHTLPHQSLPAPTRAQEQDVVGAVQALSAVHADLLVAPLALQQQGLAAHGAVHQEVVLDKVQHLIWHLQRRIDLQVPCVAGDALQGKEGPQEGLGKWVGTTLWQSRGPGQQQGQRCILSPGRCQGATYHAWPGLWDRADVRVPLLRFAVHLLVEPAEGALHAAHGEGAYGRAAQSSLVPGGERQSPRHDQALALPSPPSCPGSPALTIAR